MQDYSSTSNMIRVLSLKKSKKN